MSTQIFSKAKLQNLTQSLIAFLRHPIREIPHVPDWTWPELITVQVLVTSLTGAVAGLVARSVIDIFVGIVFRPIITLVTLLISALFFYYFFQIFAQRTLDFRKLTIVIFFSSLPFFIFHILSGLIPPINLIGFAFTAVILVVGLVENFQLPKKLVLRAIAGIYIVIFLMWIWGRWDSLQIETGWRGGSIENEAPEVHLGQ
ncbi:MAG: YIP1 family protein [Bdellovibrionaceae bacterium]|nr:YIP1 family protein [Pseudobdellovibrionaceae bacterium]